MSNQDPVEEFEQNEAQEIAPLSRVAPAPFDMMMGILTTDGKRLPVIRFETALGSFVFPMSPDKAREFALELSSCAAKCDGGLIVPGSGLSS